MQPDRHDILKIAAPLAMAGAAVAVAFIAGIPAAGFAVIGLGMTAVATTLLRRPVPELKPIPVRVDRRR